jgi:crotonobetainyl-CoA:carnitine CoA-transferase CaiB-like acyl-CoA transferase
MGDAALAKHADYDSVSKRSANRVALRALIETSFKSLTVEQVKQRLDAADIGYGQMNDMADLWAHPQLKARERWRQVGTSAGPIPAMLPPGRNPAYEARMDAVPAIGEHTEAILREFGVDDASLAALKADSAI